jgi:HD superfamily phosphodiesterase
MIAGIAIPDSALGREATEFVREASTPLLFHHSRRVFVWASMQAERLSVGYDPELLYVGAMFHDVGLLEGHRPKHERFEIDGANAARAFLERHGLPEEHVMRVWESIAAAHHTAGAELHAAGGATRGLRCAVRRPRRGFRHTLTAEQRDAVLVA